MIVTHIRLLFLLFIFLTFTCLPASCREVVTVPDDASSIGQALTLVDEGGTVIVKSGTYRGYIYIVKPVAIIGEDEPLILDPIIIESTGNVTVKGLTIIISPPGTEEAIFVKNSTNVVLEKVKIFDTGMIIYQSVNVTVRSCEFVESPGPSIAVKAGSNSILIESCSFNQSYIGLSVFEAAEVTFRFNTVYDAKSLVVKLYPQALNVTVYMNNFLGEAEAADMGSGNSWFNSTLKLGNYWSMWKSVKEDADGDGIIDEPKPIEGIAKAVDQYPLANPFQEYIVENKRDDLQKYLLVLIVITLAVVLILVAIRRVKTYMSIL